MKKSSSFVLCSLALFSFMALQGCRGYVYTGPHHPGWGHHPGYGGGWGHPGHGGGWGHGPGHGGPGHGGHHRMTADNADVSTSDESVDSAALLASDYGIKAESAEKIIRFAGAADLSASLDEMGLSAADAASLSGNSMPSQEAIQKVAAQLGEDSSKIEAILADFIADAQAADAE